MCEGKFLDWEVRKGFSERWHFRLHQNRQPWEDGEKGDTVPSGGTAHVKIWGRKNSLIWGGKRPLFLHRTLRTAASTLLGGRQYSPMSRGFDETLADQNLPHVQIEKHVTILLFLKQLKNNTKFTLVWILMWNTLVGSNDCLIAKSWEKVMKSRNPFSLRALNWTQHSHLTQSSHV